MREPVSWLSPSGCLPFAREPVCRQRTTKAKAQAMTRVATEDHASGVVHTREIKRLGEH